MKKILAILMALVIIATCGVAMADAPKIGITIYQFADNFMTLYREELARYRPKTAASRLRTSP